MNQSITMLSDIPGHDDEKYKNKVGHSTLVINGSTIFLNDLIDESIIEVGNNIQFVLDFNTEEELRNVFTTLKLEGVVVVPLQEVHWGALFGTVRDKYGVTWQLYSGHK
jgi:PhnB protein